MPERLLSGLLAGAATLLLPAIAFAAGGTPIDEAAQNGVDIAVGLGAIATAAGVVGACAGAMMRNGALLAGGATTAVCGGAWAGAPQVVEQVVGAGAGFALSDLLTSPPTYSTIDTLVRIIG